MTDELKSKRKKGASSVFNGLLRLTDWIYRKATCGFIGRIFSSYTGIDRAFKRSLTVSVLGGSSKFASKMRRLKFAVAEQFEESRLMHAWRRFISFLERCKLKFYGSFILTFGIYTGMVFFFKKYVLNDLSASPSYVAFAIVMTLASIPLILSKRTLLGGVVTSRFGHFLAVKTFGIPIEKFDRSVARHGDSYNIAIILGVLAGALTYLVDPLHILAAFAVFSFIALVISYPEIGVLAAIATLPLYSVFGHGLLIALVSLYSVSYLVKLVRGKRIVSFEIYDLFVLLFGAVLLFGGLVSTSTSSGESAVCSLILLFCCFVAGNLMRTKLWQIRAVFAFCFSGYAVSFLLIWQYVCERCGTFLGQDLPYFKDGLSFFGNRALLSIFLSTALIITLSLCKNAPKGKARRAARMSVLVIAAATVLTAPAIGLISVTVSLLIYFIIVSRKTLPFIILSGIAIPTAGLFAPKGFLLQKLSAFWSTDPLSLQGVSKIRDGSYAVIRASLFSGVGTGGFSEVYPMYAAVGFEAVANSGSTWLSIMTEQGIVALLLLAVIVFLIIQNCCEAMIRSFKNEAKALPAAGFASLIGILIQASFVDVWTDPCTFFLFWMIPAMLMAGIRVCRREEEKGRDVFVGNEYSASVDI